MKTLRLQINSQSGHYNLMDSRDESIRTSFRLFEDGNSIGYASITSEQEINESYFDPDLIGFECADMIEAYEKSLWISTGREEALAFALLLRKKNKAIIKGNKKYKIKMLLEKKVSIENQLKALGVKL
jgi:hypothetical protein